MSVRFIAHQLFFTAVQSGDLKSLKEIIKNEGLDPDHAVDASVSCGLMELQNDKGETALYIAAEKNHEKIFIYLLQFCDLKIVKIKSKSSGLDAFHVAAKHGHLGTHL